MFQGYEKKLAIVVQFYREMLHMAESLIGLFLSPSLLAPSLFLDLSLTLLTIKHMFLFSTFTGEKIQNISNFALTSRLVKTSERSGALKCINIHYRFLSDSTEKRLFFSERMILSFWDDDGEERIVKF